MQLRPLRLWAFFQRSILMRLRVYENREQCDAAHGQTPHMVTQPEARIACAI